VYGRHELYKAHAQSSGKFWFSVAEVYASRSSFVIVECYVTLISIISILGTVYL